MIKVMCGHNCTENLITVLKTENKQFRHSTKRTHLHWGGKQLRERSETELHYEHTHWPAVRECSFFFAHKPFIVSGASIWKMSPYLKAFKSIAHPKYLLNHKSLFCAGKEKEKRESYKMSHRFSQSGSTLNERPQRSKRYKWRLFAAKGKSTGTCTLFLCLSLVKPMFQWHLL